MPATKREIEESLNRFLQDLIDQVSFVQDLLIITGTMLEEVQKSIYILLEELRKRILEVVNEWTIKLKKRREEVKIWKLLEKGELASLSNLKSESSKEDEIIFTDTTAVQGEEVLETATPEKST